MDKNYVIQLFYMTSGEIMMYITLEMFNFSFETFADSFAFFLALTYLIVSIFSIY